MNKKGVQLAINIIVLIIIGSIMFFSSMYIFANILDKSKEVSFGIDERTKSEMQRRCNDGSPVFSCESSQTLRKIETVEFLMGVNNIFPSTRTFYIETEVPEGTENDLKILFLDESFEIRGNENHVFSLIVETETHLERGQYPVVVRIYIEESGGERSLHGSRILYVNFR